MAIHKHELVLCRERKLIELILGDSLTIVPQDRLEVDFRNRCDVGKFPFFMTRSRKSAVAELPHCRTPKLVKARPQLAVQRSFERIEV